MSKGEDQIAEQFYQGRSSPSDGEHSARSARRRRFTPDEQKMIRAVSKAHLRTGLPIFTHIPHDQLS